MGFPSKQNCVFDDYFFFDEKLSCNVATMPGSGMGDNIKVHFDRFMSLNVPK